MKSAGTGIWILYALAGWLSCFAVMGIGRAVFPMRTALIVHAAAAPVLFGVLSLIYFRKNPASGPLATACRFTGFIVLMDFFVVALVINRSLAMFASVIGTWLPFALIFLSTWAVGIRVRTRKSRE
jgi:hypothetical protein